MNAFSFLKGAAARTQSLGRARPRLGTRGASARRQTQGSSPAPGRPEGEHAQGEGMRVTWPWVASSGNYFEP